MCGRFALAASAQEVARALGVEMVEPFPPRYNIAPTQPVSMVVAGPDGKRQALLVRWGLVPAWVKDPAAFSLLINARGETAATKPSFRNAMRHRRALIPATGFYEWKALPGGKGRKQPYWVRPRAGGVVAFAGLMETWHGADGSEIDTGCILTTQANGEIAEIHHRMPVVIALGDMERWLDCINFEPRDVAELLSPPDPDFFEAIPVGDKVNKVANSGPDIQEPVSAAEAERHARRDEAGRAEASAGQLDLF